MTQTTRKGSINSRNSRNNIWDPPSCVCALPRSCSLELSACSLEEGFNVHPVILGDFPRINHSSLRARLAGEAISYKAKMDCFVAALLAMTGTGGLWNPASYN